MKSIIKSLIAQKLTTAQIAEKLNTTVWQIRKVRKELSLENTNNTQKLVTKDLKIAHSLSRKKFPRTIILTAWEIRCGISEEYLDILNQIKVQYDAELFIVPLWPDDLKYLPVKLKQFNILTSDLEINKNLFFKYVPTHGLVQSVISGWRGAFPDKSVIIPGLIRDMITEPSHHLAKQLMSTGSIGKLDPTLTNYSHLQDLEGAELAQFNKRWSSVTNRRNGKIYAIAQEYTVPSALIVDVIDSKTFLSRYISMPQTGVVHDLNLKYTSGKSKPEIVQPEALVIGDSHVWQLDETAWKATFEMIDFYKPKSVVLHDFADMASCNYHEVADAAAFNDAPTIETEAKYTREKLLEIVAKVPKIYYNHSNHDDFIIKYLKNESNYRYNRNYAICLELRAWQVRTGRHPIIKLLDLDSISNLEFVAYDANHKIAGVTNIHGHQDVNGRRVGFKGLVQVFNNVMMGHGHNPQFFRNGGMVGTTGSLDQGYNKGIDGWLHCNGLIHSDSSSQLATIIGKIWKK